MRDIEFKVKERCRTEGTRVKLKNDYNTYIYLGCAHDEEDYSVKRILKRADYKESTIKIVDNEEYLDNVYLDFSCLDNLKALEEELKRDHGFKDDPEKFFETYLLYKENYSKIKTNEEKGAFSDIYRQYEKGLRKNIINVVTEEFEENKSEVEFISSIVLDLVFQQFVWPIYMKDMEKQNQEKKAKKENQNE